MRSAGFQAQTAECLVVGEIAARNMVVALNKVDLLPEVVRSKAVKKATKLIRETLAATKFAGAAVIPVSAKPSEQQTAGCCCCCCLAAVVL
jgi:selenocysteine-specific elongation factor